MKLRRLLFGRKIMTNLDSVLKSRDVTLPTKVRIVKALVFPIVMYGCESWNIKKAELQRIDAFELWCWRRLLRVPCKEIQPVHPKGNQSWIFIGRTDVEAEAPILMGRTDLFEKTLMLGKIEGGGEGDDRRWDGWMASPTQWIWVWANSGIGDGQRGLVCDHGVAKSWTQLNDSTELKIIKRCNFKALVMSFYY